MLLFSEFNVNSGHSGSVLLFKRGSRNAITNAAEGGSDEEKAAAAVQGVEPIEKDEATKRALAESMKMKDVFTWQEVSYTIPIGDGKRKLLDDISGYAVPGKLTALMGESGAGKVSSTLCFYLMTTCTNTST